MSQSEAKRSRIYVTLRFFQCKYFPAANVRSGDTAIDLLAQWKATPYTDSRTELNMFSKYKISQL